MSPWLLGSLMTVCWLVCAQSLVEQQWVTFAVNLFAAPVLSIEYMRRA